jgi:hypothetical protein
MSRVMRWRGLFLGHMVRLVLRYTLKILISSRRSSNIHRSVPFAARSDASGSAASPSPHLDRAGTLDALEPYWTSIEAGFPERVADGIGVTYSQLCESGLPSTEAMSDGACRSTTRARWRGLPVFRGTGDAFLKMNRHGKKCASDIASRRTQHSIIVLRFLLRRPRLGLPLSRHYLQVLLHLLQHHRLPRLGTSQMLPFFHVVQPWH